MASIQVGLVADPAAPTEIARAMADLTPVDGTDRWDITVLSQPFRRDRLERVRDSDA